MATWFDLRDGIAFQEVNVFQQELHQTKNISEKASLDKLFRPSQKLAYEVVHVYTAFFSGKKTTGKANGKSNQATKALTHFWRRWFSPEDNKKWI